MSTVSGHVQTCSDMSNMSRHDTHHLQAACIFSLARQLSQLCAQNLHIFAYYPGMARAGVSSASGALSHTFFPTTFPHPTRYDASTALCGGVPVLVRCGFTVASFTGTFRKLIAERFAASGANLTPAPPRAPNASASCTLRGNSLICGGVVSGFAKLVDVAIRRSGHTAIATSAQPQDSFTPHTDTRVHTLHYCTTHALNFWVWSA